MSEKNPGDERCEWVVLIGTLREGIKTTAWEARVEPKPPSLSSGNRCCCCCLLLHCFMLLKKLSTLVIFKKKILKTFIRYFRKDKNGIGAGSIEFRISRQKCMFLSRELSSPISTRSCHACTQIEGPFLLWAFPAFPNFFGGGAAAQDMH